MGDTIAALFELDGRVARARAAWMAHRKANYIRLGARARPPELDTADDDARAVLAANISSARAELESVMDAADYDNSSAMHTILLISLGEALETYIAAAASTVEKK